MKRDVVDVKREQQGQESPRDQSYGRARWLARQSRFKERHWFDNARCTEAVQVRKLKLGAWQFRWGFSLGGVTYLSSWGNIWFQRPLRWRVASARKASSPLRLQNWPVSLKRRWYWEQVDSIAPEPTGWPRAFPLL